VYEDEDVVPEVTDRRPRPPWYILSYDNKLLITYKAIVYFITIPFIMLNLYLVAFAT